MAEAQHRYVALLRGINVGGSMAIKMADLRAPFEACGLTDVATYIQSGNVLFTSEESDPERLARRLEQQLASSLGYKWPVFLLSPAHLAKAAAENPFDPEGRDKGWSCNLMFLSGEPDPARCEALMALQGEDYRIAVRGKVLYYAYPTALAGRRRTINFEKVLGVLGTARNWKVVRELIRLTR